MKAILGILRAYFLFIGAVAAILLLFVNDMPHTYALGFSLFALPTLPIVELLYPLFEQLGSADVVMLILICVVSVAYSATVHFLLSFLKARVWGDSESGKPA